MAKCPKCNGKGKVRKVLPETLRALRKKSTLSLRRFGKKIGFSAMYLSEIERGDKRATPEIVKAYQKL